MKQMSVWIYIYKSLPFANMDALPIKTSIKSQGIELKFYGDFHNEHMTTPLCKNMQVAPYWASPVLKYDWIGWINVVD